MSESLDQRLTGRVAVVTGGSRGIGTAVASALVERGADVVICGRSDESLAEAKSLMTARLGAASGSGRLETVRADIRDATQTLEVVSRAEASFGGVDILVNNAGVGRFQDLADQPVEEWLEVLETNLTGLFYCCRAALPALRRRGGGWIVNVSSLAGSNPFAGGTAYCASKAGVDALSHALMQEVRHENIRVSCVAPGSVDTRFADAPAGDASWKLTAADVARAVIDLLLHDPRSLPSRVELRPARPRK